MKIDDLTQPPAGYVMQAAFEIEDNKWAEIFYPASELSMQFVNDGENVQPAIILQTDKLDSKIAFQLNDVEGINALIARLEYYKKLIQHVEKKEKLKNLRAKLYGHGADAEANN